VKKTAHIKRRLQHVMLSAQSIQHSLQFELKGMYHQTAVFELIIKK